MQTLCLPDEIEIIADEALSPRLVDRQVWECAPGNGLMIGHEKVVEADVETSAKALWSHGLLDSQETRQAWAEKARMHAFTDLTSSLAQQLVELTVALDTQRHQLTGLQRRVDQQQVSFAEVQHELARHSELLQAPHQMSKCDCGATSIGGAHDLPSSPPSPPSSPPQSPKGCGRVRISVVEGNHGDPVEQLWKAPLPYQIQETIWDSCLFVGAGIIHPAESIQVVVLIVLNYIAQLVFILAIFLDPEMTTNRFNNPSMPENMLRWRASYGHDLAYVDAIENKPLVRQVCQNSDLLIEGNLQAYFFETMDRYVGGSNGAQIGPYLCLIALYMWWLSILQELSSLVYFHRAVWAQEHSSTTTLEMDNDVLVFKTISRHRALSLAMFVTLPRAIIAILLAYYGSRYLLSTVEIESIITNCVALDIVMRVDEMTFAALMPTAVCSLIHKAGPLCIPRFRRRALQKISFARLVVMMVVLGFVFFFELEPMVQRMRISMENLCGGANSSFVAFRRESGMIKLGSLLPIEDSLQSYSSRAVLHRAGLRHVDRDTFYGRWGTSMSLHAALAQSLVPIEEITVACKDYIQYSPVLSIEVLADSTGDPSVESCEDAADFCGKSNHPLVRFYCPETCGCADPLSGLFVAEGCPTSCSQYFSAALNEQICADPVQSVDAGTTDSLLAYVRNFYYELYHTAGNVEGDGFFFAPTAEEIGRLVTTQGCSFFGARHIITRSGQANETYEVDFCDPSNTFLAGRRTVRPLCPGSCHCHVEHVYEAGDCPGQCKP